MACLYLFSNNNLNRGPHFHQIPKIGEEGPCGLKEVTDKFEGCVLYDT